MTGYWPSSCFFLVFMDLDFVSVHKHAKKLGQYPAILTEQAWSIIHTFLRLTARFLAVLRLTVNPIRAVYTRAAYIRRGMVI